ncbi:hypothetical protein HGRIS_003048 [Hohenbuehelia grisea]|uniref:Signal peptidase subunit 3 n=1 Tax=Hohenbuehelia grisea TaxID=104357 RepID=A0ABR3JN25_9AGAR
MHSIFARLNNSTSLLSSCLMGLLFAISLTTFLFNEEAHGQIVPASVKVLDARLPRQRYRTQEAVFTQFNVTADLTPLFHWNTKQVFVYLQAEYNNSKGVQNEVVVWDRIVRRKSDAVIRTRAMSKYSIRDLTRSFKKIPGAHFTLKYNIMPYVGVLTSGDIARTSELVTFPAAQRAVS